MYCIYGLYAYLRQTQFTLEQATKAQSGSIGISLLFFNLGAIWEWVVNSTHRPLYPQETDLVPSV